MATPAGAGAARRSNVARAAFNMRPRGVISQDAATGDVAITWRAISPLKRADHAALRGFEAAALAQLV